MIELAKQIWPFLLAGVVALIVLIVVAASASSPSTGVSDEWRRKSKVWGTRGQARKAGFLAGTTTKISGSKRLVTETNRLYAGMIGKSRVVLEKCYSMLVLAGTGGGKTLRLVLPNVLRWDGPVVVTSTKPDIYALTREPRSKKGRIRVFAPLPVPGIPEEELLRYSPLLHVDSYADAEDSTADLVEGARKKGDSSGTQNSAFWDSRGRMLIAPMEFAAEKTGGAIYDVTDWLNSGRSGEEDVDRILRRLADPRALTQWEGHTSQHDETKKNVLSTAATLMEVWGREAARPTFDVLSDSPRPVFNVEEFLDSADTIYVIAPATDQEKFVPVFESFMNGIVRAVEKRFGASGEPLKKPLLLAIDEAANIAPLRRLETIITTARAMGLCLLTVWQSRAQIRSRYGKDIAETIDENHAAMVVLPRGYRADSETLELCSKAVGKDYHRQTSVTRSERGSRNDALQEDVVASVNWLQQRPADEAIVFVRGMTLRTKVAAYYEDKKMRAEVDPHGAAAPDDFYGQNSATRRIHG
jgi:type IV secretory pathway TraG/TraD family ATPase VirD4